MRADKFFAEKFGSRTKAADALRRGLVLCNGKALSPDDDVSDVGTFSFLERSEQFVSNGGYKLARGLDFFGEKVENSIFADLGASTGGFTDCLLRRGAGHVFCVDVGESLLAPEIAGDPRVTVMDNTNARYLTVANFPCPLDGVVSDLSFISLRLVLPAIKELLTESGRSFLLFKPQFECGKKALGKSGICPQRLHDDLLGEFYDFAVSMGFSPQNIVNAPLREKKNIEYILFLKRKGDPIPQYEFLRRAKNLLD